MSYNHLRIEKKWQEYWSQHQSFRTEENHNKQKYYALDMFPYPSGQGLHVGHPEGYTATDIISRYKRMQGFNVMHPMGWDAFGLPAEQYAIETGHDPKEFTDKNIANFKKQINSIGLSYDWTREIATCEPEYYHWTQWIFSQLYKKGLAELKNIEVNWCEELGTVLANEEIINENGIMVSERGNHPVEKKPMKQWVLKITKYADRLLNDLDELDWPESIKEMQRNWIGKSVGAHVDFKVQNTNEKFTVFTTRPDTLFGATYCVLAPEHDLVKKITTEDQKDAVEQYILFAKSKSDLDRTELNKEKTGCFTGAYAINPVNQKAIPIWIADYVLSSYGTGAIMAVPAHDDRDYEFAKKFNLAIIQVLEGDISNEAWTKDGLHINSGFIDGLNKEDAITKMNEFLEKIDCGKAAVNYRLRDWIFSRQRYWGEPFPIIHYEDGTIELVDENELPVVLPKMEKIKPSGTGESPLANATEWLEVTRSDGVKGRRETNTMPQWAGSCWYYIGYLLKNPDGSMIPLNSQEAKDILNYWLPVDLYIGGAEHAVLHLLYARFWHKVLYDIGIVKTKEPFYKLFNQGMILGADNVKMSKSRGNVINPDDIIQESGADTLRIYEMFMGPLEAMKPWSTKGVEGARRFLERVERLYSEVIVIDDNNNEMERVYHQTVKKVTEDIENLRFNTAIAQMMIFTNEAYKVQKIKREYAEGFLKILNPFAPHLAEEIWNTFFQKEESLVYEPWPKYIDELTKSDEVTVVIQINGKLRDKLVVSKDMPKVELETLALNTPKIVNMLNGATPKKVIIVPNRLVNIVL